MIYLQLYFLAGVLHDPPYTEGGSEMPYREERETRRLGEPSRFVFPRTSKHKTAPVVKTGAVLRLRIVKAPSLRELDCRSAARLREQPIISDESE